MTSLNRVRVKMEGFPGAPGVMTFYTLDTSTFLPSLQTLLAAWATQMPTDVRMLIEPTGDVISDVNGTLVGAWSDTPQVETVGVQATAYAAPVGAICNWGTDTILDGRRVKGRTFVVPLGVEVFNNQGQPTAGAIAAIQNAGLEFIIEQSASFVLWHRPRLGPKPVGGGDRPITRNGGHGLVTSAKCPAFSAVLRSRRD